MSKTIHCKDLGLDCDFVAKADTEETLLEQVAHHASTVHGINEITPELLGQVKSAIRIDER